MSTARLRVLTGLTLAVTLTPGVAHASGDGLNALMDLTFGALSLLGAALGIGLLVGWARWARRAEDHAPLRVLGRGILGKAGAALLASGVVVGSVLAFTSHAAPSPPAVPFATLTLGFGIVAAQSLLAAQWCAAAPADATGARVSKWFERGIGGLFGGLAILAGLVAVGMAVFPE